jgi:hypothetical protein
MIGDVKTPRKATPRRTGAAAPRPAKKAATKKKSAAASAASAKPKKATPSRPSDAPAQKKSGAKPSTAGRRPDFGAPIEGFFEKQPPELRDILDELRRLVAEIAPEAAASLKWGMPFFTIGGAPMCALAGFKSHVNLILAGPPESFVDPDGLLEGDGKTGRHLKLRSLATVPHDAVRTWLRTAAKRARAEAVSH